MHLNTMGELWMVALWRASWQGGIALATVWCICRFVPRISPGFKVWLWRLAWLKLLVALFWSGSIDLPLLAPHREQVATTQPLQAESALFVIAVEATNNPAKESNTAITVPGVLFILWLAGVLVTVLRLAHEWRRSALLKRDSSPIANDTLQELCAALGIRRVPALRQSTGIHAPMLVGIVTPTVIFPMNVKDHALSMMLAHELAHLKRRDLLWAWLPAICHTLFFFHPLLWLTRREWLLAQEMACDRLALHHSAASTAAYGNMLVDLLTGRLLKPQFGAMGISENIQNLKRRIVSMKTIDRRTSRRLMAILLIVNIGAALPWRIVAQDKPEDASKRVKLLEKENAELRAELDKVRQTAGAPKVTHEELRTLESSRVAHHLATEIIAAEVELAAIRSQYADGHPKVAEAETRLRKLKQLQADAGSSRAEEGARVKKDTDTIAAQMAALEADLKVLRNRLADQHPAVLEAQKRLETLKERHAAGASHAATENRRAARERELYLEELFLAQKYADSMRRQMKNGRATQEELLRAQRQVFGIQREIAKLDADRAKLKEVVQEEMAAVQRLLQEAKTRIEVGTAAPGHDLDLQREMLRLKRELLSLEEP